MAFDTLIDKTQLEKEMKATADSIRAKTGDTGSIEWVKDTGFANAVSYITTGATEENRLTFTGSITETTVGSGKYIVLLKNDKLAEIRNEVDLFVRVEFDIDPTPYTIVKSWACNNTDRIIIDSTTSYQIIHRWEASSKKSIGTIVYAINDNTSPTSSVGRLYITEDGELRVYSNSSSNYAIRPSNYKAIVEW